MSAVGWVLDDTFLYVFVISPSWRILSKVSCVTVKIVIVTSYPRVDYVDLLKSTGLSEEVYKGRVIYIFSFKVGDCLPVKFSSCEYFSLCRCNCRTVRRISIESWFSFTVLEMAVSGLVLLKCHYL